MNKKNDVLTEAVPGTSSVPEISHVQVKEFLKKDLAACLNMLEAIYRDEDMLDLLATVMLGKFQNAKHLKELNFGRGESVSAQS